MHLMLHVISGLLYWHSSSYIMFEMTLDGREVAEFKQK
jgi:hypothetical protein